jgi:hypothetical protein
MAGIKEPVVQSDEEIPAATLASRAADADRQRAVDVIKAAFDEGRLNQDEYSKRVSMVPQSRTYAELQKLTADLPAGPLGAFGSMAAGPPPSAAIPFDVRAALMCGGSVALIAFFAAFPFSPWPLLAGIILSVVASARSARYGPRWERLAIWSVSGATLAVFIWFILHVFA